MTALQHWHHLSDEPAGAATRKRLQGGGASLVRTVVPAGTVAVRPSHTHEQFVQVLSGSGTLEKAEGRQAFMAGSLFHFAPDAWHAAKFATDTVLVETNIAAPRRGHRPRAGAAAHRACRPMARAHRSIDVGKIPTYRRGVRCRGVHALHLSLLSDGYVSDSLADAGPLWLDGGLGRAHRDGLLRGLLFAASQGLPLALTPVEPAKVALPTASSLHVTHLRMS